MKSFRGYFIAAALLMCAAPMVASAAMEPVPLEQIDQKVFHIQDVATINPVHVIRADRAVYRLDYPGADRDFERLRVARINQRSASIAYAAQARHYDPG